MSAATCPHRVARDDGELHQQSSQETMVVVGTVGSVAASFLGAFVAAEIDDD